MLEFYGITPRNVEEWGVDYENYARDDERRGCAGKACGPNEHNIRLQNDTVGNMV